MSNKTKIAIPLPPKRDITLKLIGGKVVSTKIRTEDEEAMRLAASEVNRLYSIYKDRYGGNSNINDLDLMVYTALDLAFRIECNKLKKEDKSRLLEVMKKLDEAMKPQQFTPGIDPKVI